MRNFVLPLLASSLVACGGSAPPSQAPPPAAPPSAQRAAAKPAPEPQPASSIRRSQMRGILTAGPGAFLQRVTLDDRAVFLGGRFHGFRVQHLNDPEFWKGVDLKEGDVITHVNGFPIEHPEEALEAFKSLEVASELRVGYEREGVPRELRYGIIDDEAPPAPASAAPPSKSLK